MERGWTRGGEDWWNEGAKKKRTQKEKRKTRMAGKEGCLKDEGTEEEGGKKDKGTEGRRVRGDGLKGEEEGEEKKDQLERRRMLGREAEKGLRGGEEGRGKNRD